MMYMVTRHVSVVPMHMDVMQSVYTSSQIVWTVLGTFYTLAFPDLSAVRQFLLKQAQLKCFTLGKLTVDCMDAIDLVKVLKCYSVILIT